MALENALTLARATRSGRELYVSAAVRGRIGERLAEQRATLERLLVSASTTSFSRALTRWRAAALPSPRTSPSSGGAMRPAELVPSLAGFAWTLLHATSTGSRTPRSARRSWCCSTSCADRRRRFASGLEGARWSEIGDQPGLRGMPPQPLPRSPAGVGLSIAAKCANQPKCSAACSADLLMTLHQEREEERAVVDVQWIRRGGGDGAYPSPD